MPIQNAHNKWATLSQNDQQVFVKKKFSRALQQLTFTCAALLFISWFAETSTNRNQPLAVSAAVHFRLLPFFWLVDTRTSDLDQWGRVRSGDRVGKSCQVPNGERTCFVENPDGNQSDAGAHILKGQVEAFPCCDSYISHLRVEFHDAVSDIHLSGKENWVTVIGLCWKMCRSLLIHCRTFNRSGSFNWTMTDVPISSTLLSFRLTLYWFQR